MRSLLISGELIMRDRTTMVQNVLVFILIFTCFTFSFGQNQNVTLIGNVNDYPEEGYSDCWGYTAPNGDEYALLGINGGISIIDLSDTSNIAEVDFISWVTADPYGWYDMKTYKITKIFQKNGKISELFPKYKKLDIFSCSNVGFRVILRFLGRLLWYQLSRE